MQVIDLVLKDPGVPAFSLHSSLHAAFVYKFHRYASRARDHGCVSGHAQTAFEEFCPFFAHADDLRIDDRVEGNWTASALDQVFGSRFDVILRPAFDDGK